jgi:hypothetical protein
VGVVDFAENL